LRYAGLFCLLLLVCTLPVRAEEPDFDGWLAAVRAEAISRDISPAIVDAALAETRPIDRVLELDRRQPEGTLEFEAYLARIVTDRRVRDGHSLLSQHSNLLARLQREYGVQPRILVALWGIESDFGRRTGTFRVVDALATLAFDGRRSEFFRGELLDALTILDQGHVEPSRMLGSWAGAMGQPQFMPSSFLRYAVDHDRDARRDIWDSTADTLASAANYLASHGWDPDLKWGRAVRLPGDFDHTLVGRQARRSLEQWHRLGVRRADGSALPSVDITGWIVTPGDETGPAYLVYDNYGVLLKWNRSDYFATAVGILSDRLRKPGVRASGGSAVPVTVAIAEAE
jgi:membrane-bound lytic murein transglycosylase B